MFLKTDTIVSLNQSYCHDLKELAYKLTGSTQFAEEITRVAFLQLVKNSFWIWNEKQAKKYLERVVNRECKKFIKARK